MPFFAFSSLVTFVAPYCLLAMFINQRVVTLANGHLSVTTGPMFVGGNLTLDPHDIAEFYWQRTPNFSESGSERFQVRVLLHNGGFRVVLSQLQREEACFYVETLNGALKDFCG
jgi:hypothetical protein